MPLTLARWQSLLCLLSHSEPVPTDLIIGCFFLIIEQSADVYSSLHLHFDFTQSPFPLHNPGHLVSLKSVRGIVVSLLSGCGLQYEVFLRKISSHPNCIACIADIVKSSVSVICDEIIKILNKTFIILKEIWINV